MNPAVLVLATQRLTMLLAEDQLTRPVRERINRWAADAAEFTLKDRVATLASCSACLSVWSAAAVLLASRTRAGRPLVIVLAASGAALMVKAVHDKLEA